MKVKASQFIVYIEQDEDGMFIGSVASIPSCYAEGKTQEEMLKNLAEVIKLCLQNSSARELPKNRFIGIQNLELSNV